MLLLTQLAKVPKIPTDKDCSCSITCDWIGELPIGKLLPITFIIVRPFRKPNSSFGQSVGEWKTATTHLLTPAQLSSQVNETDSPDLVGTCGCGCCCFCCCPNFNLFCPPQSSIVDNTDHLHRFRSGLIPEKTNYKETRNKFSTILVRQGIRIWTNKSTIAVQRALGSFRSWQWCA